VAQYKLKHRRASRFDGRRDVEGKRPRDLPDALPKAGNELDDTL
jgi:hypothetical protein